MAEAGEIEKLKLDYFGDEILKGFIERNFQHVKVDCSDGNVLLEGRPKDLRKVKNAFYELKIDLERKEFILTEGLTLKYLNEKIGSENCYLVKDKNGIYAFIPHHRKDDHIKKMEELVKDEICKVDEITVNTDDLLLDHAEKICRYGTTVLVFTKDIENLVNKVIRQARTHSESAEEISGNSQARQTDFKVSQSNFNIFLDHNGQRFIEKHCPNVSVHRTGFGFSLHTKSSDHPKTTVDVVALDVDNNGEQLILTEDGIIDFLNQKLQSESILCYLVKDLEKIYGVMPSDYKDYKDKVLYCVNENICVRKVDVHDHMVYDLLMDFSGHITHVIRENESFLVFTKYVEEEVDKYMKKLCQDNGAQKEIQSHKSDSESDVESDYETLTYPRGATLEGNTDSGKMNNYDKQDQNRECCKTVDDIGEESHRRDSIPENEIGNSFEAVEIQKMFMNEDLADYIFIYRQDEIKNLKKSYDCFITNDNGIISIDGKNQSKIEDGMNKIAQNACMHSFFIDGYKFKTSQTETFQDFVENLNQEGTQVKIKPCFRTQVVTSIVEKNVTVELVCGSAAGIKQTDAILCPLDSNVNEVCASAGHIMSKGGGSLKQLCVSTASRSKKPAFHLEILRNPKGSQLTAQTVFGIVLGDWFDGPKDYEEKLQNKFQHVFQQTIEKHHRTVAIPLEVGRRVPVFVMARVCCRALKIFLTEKPSTVLKKVSLCVVDKSCLPSLTDLLQSEFRKEGQDPIKAIAGWPGVSGSQKGKPPDDNSSFDDILPVQVFVKVGSLTDQKVEAIVVPVSSRLDLKTGPLSRAVKRDAGEVIETELKNKEPKGLGPMEVTYTGPGNLQMKNILFSSLPKLNDKYGSQEKCIGILMENIFKQLQELKIKTVALPAFGTGSLEYSEKIVAIEMVRSIYLHAANFGVQMVNLVAYEKESLIHHYFSEASKVFRGATEQSGKDKAENVFIDISDVKGNQGFDCRIVESDREVPMCDIIMYHKKPAVTNSTDKYLSEGLCSRRVEHFPENLVHTEMYIDLHYVEIGIDRFDDLYNKCFSSALRTMFCQFLVIDLIAIRHEEEVKNTLDKILKILHKVLKKDDRLKQVYFLVKPVTFQKCKQYAEHHQTDKETKKNESSFFQSIFTTSPKLNWHVVPYKVPEPLGAHVVICSESEEKLQSALTSVKDELTCYRNNLDDSDTENNAADGGRRDSRLGAQRQTENFPYKIPQSNIKDGNETTDEKPPQPPKREKQHKPIQVFRRQKSVSTEEETPQPCKGQTVQKQTKLTYGQRSPFEMLTADVSNTITRHFSKKKMEYVLEVLKSEKKIHCERRGEVIKVEVAFDERDCLKGALEKGLNGYDNTRYYIREVSPQLFNLVKLYFQTRQDISNGDWIYHKLEEEIELCKSEEFYNQMKKKCELFKQYQVDTIDASNSKSSVDDVLKVFKNEHLQDENSEFSGILVESVSDNKAINIHYLAERQDKAYKVKNMLQIRLGIIKQTGRRNRIFDQYKSLEAAVILNDHPGPIMTDTQKEKEKSGHMSLTMSRNLSSSLPIQSQGGLKSFDARSDLREKSLLEAIYLTQNKLSLKVYKGNILKLNVDCIVNAANKDLAHAGGVAWVISKAAGYEFNKECSDYVKNNGQLGISDCISTGAGDLHYRRVLHAVGPRWSDYTDNDDCKKALMKTITNVLKCADDKRMKSVAIPSVSSGIFGVPWQVCAEMYAEGVLRFEEQVTSTGLEEVHFVDINEEILKEIQSVFNNVFTVQVSSRYGDGEIF